MADWLRQQFDRRESTLPVVKGRTGPAPWADSVLRGLRNDVEELQRLRARKSGTRSEYQRRVLRQTAGWQGPRPWSSNQDPRGFRQALLAEYPKEGPSRIVALAVRSVEDGLVEAVAKGEFVEPTAVTPPVVPHLSYVSRSYANSHGAVRD